MLAVANTVHTGHTAAIVDGMVRTVDTRSLAFFAAETTAVTLALVNPDFEE